MSDDGVVPEPAGVVDLAEFITALGHLRMAHGAPSYSVLAKRVGQRLRPPQMLSSSTVRDVFNARRRRLDLDLVVGIVRALGLDEVEVDHWRAACVRMHAEAKSGGPVGVYRQLPADLATFTGREVHVARILEAVSTAGEGATVVVTSVEGMAGVGKTQLAVHAAHELVRAGRFTELQLYVNLHGFDADRDPADPAAVLESLLRALEVPGSRIPPGLDERAAMFRDRLHGRQTVLILDNAADEKQVRDLIPGAPGCLVLITSRRSLAGLDGAVPLQLEVFSTREAVGLLTRIAGAERVTSEPAAAETIAAACGRLPLAVSLAAALLRSRPAWSLAHLARQLQARGLDAMTAGGRGVRLAFELSYQALPEPERELFRRLSVHPSGDFSAAAAAALTGIPGGRVEAGLEHLLNENLLEQRVEERYVLHDLLRAFADECLARDEPSAARATALDRLVTWYLQTSDAAARAALPHRRRQALPEPATPGLLCLAFETATTAQGWWSAEYHNILEIQRVAYEAGRYEAAARLPRTLHEVFHAQGYWEAALSATTLGLAAARRGDDRELQALLLNDLGSTHGRASQFEPGTAAFEEAAELFHALGETNGEATARLNLGSLNALAGRLAEAQEVVRDALTLTEAVGDKVAQAQALDVLGQIAYRTGDFEASVLHRTAARVLQSEIGSRYFEAVLTLNIGESLLRLGRLDEAAAELRRSVDENRELNHPIAEGYGWEYLGETLERQGDHDQAVEAFQQALQLLTASDPTAAIRVKTHLDRLA